MKIEEFIVEETKKNEKDTQKTYILGGILLFCVVMYLTWMVKSIQSTILEPKSLASVLTGIADEKIPMFLEEGKTSLIQMAPEMAEKAKFSAFGLIPTISEAGKEGIERAILLVPAMQLEMEEAINAHFIENKDDIKAFFDAHEGGDVANELVKELTTVAFNRLDSEMAVSNSGVGLYEVKNKTLEGLRKINTQLKVLGSKSNMQLTKEDEIQKKFITTWIQALKGNFKNDKLQLSALMEEDR